MDDVKTASRTRLINPLWWVLFIIVFLYRIITKPFPSRCRFHPTCSTYARDCLRNYGASKSLFLIICRIAKCHPFHPGGIDNVVPYAQRNKEVDTESE